MTDLYEYLAFVRSRVWKETPMPDGDRLVFLFWEDQGPEFHNLLRVDRRDKIVWVAQSSRPDGGVYIAARFRTARLEAYNKAGLLDVIDYATGKAVAAESQCRQGEPPMTDFHRLAASVGAHVVEKIPGLKGDMIVTLDWDRWEGELPSLPNLLQTSANLVRIDPEGRIVWRVQREQLLHPYYAAEMKEGKLEARGGESIDTIDYETGKVIHSVYSRW